MSLRTTIGIWLACSAFLFSCTTQKGLTKAGFTSVFSSEAFKHTGERNKLPLLSLFGFKTTTSDSVRVSMNAAGEITLQFRDSLGPREEVFKGKYKDKRYTEIFLTKRRIHIPPLFPILYGLTEIDRLRVGVDDAGNLVIWNKWVRKTNLLILGGGGRFQSEYRYRNLRL